MIDNIRPDFAIELRFEKKSSTRRLIAIDRWNERCEVVPQTIGPVISIRQFNSSVWMRRESGVSGTIAVTLSENRTTWPHSLQDRVRRAAAGDKGSSSTEKARARMRTTSKARGPRLNRNSSLLRLLDLGCPYRNSGFGSIARPLESFWQD